METIHARPNIGIKQPKSHHISSPIQIINNSSVDSNKEENSKAINSSSNPIRSQIGIIYSLIPKI